MVLQTMAFGTQWLCSDHVITPTDTNAAIALQQRSGVFYAIRGEMLLAGPVSCVRGLQYKRLKLGVGQAYDPSND
jgi:hypothetical protein